MERDCSRKMNKPSIFNSYLKCFRKLEVQHQHQPQQQPQLCHHQMDVGLHNGFKMVFVILKTITLDAIGMEATAVTILILNGKNIVKFQKFANVLTQILELILMKSLLESNETYVVVSNK